MSDSRPQRAKRRPEDDYASYAWLLIGTLHTQAGWLDLTGDRLRFSTADKVVFDVPLAEVTDVVWPWYYFGGGVKLRAAGEPHRISFVLPNGADYPAARAGAAEGDPASLVIVWQKAADIGDGRGVGKEWRRRLEAAATPSTSPSAS